MTFSPPEAIVIAERFTQAFPELQASWYIMGSHATGDEIDLSDVDVAALCKSLPVDALELGRRLQLPFDGKVDLWLKHPDWINRFPDAPILPMLNHAILFKGNDLRPGLPEVDLDAYNESIAAGFGQAIEHFHPDRKVEVPPEGTDEFLGYVDRAPSWARLERWTHGIVVLIGKAASAVSACDRADCRIPRGGVGAVQQMQGCGRVARVVPSMCRPLARVVEISSTRHSGRPKRAPQDLRSGVRT